MKCENNDISKATTGLLSCNFIVLIVFMALNIVKIRDNTWKEVNWFNDVKGSLCLTINKQKFIYLTLVFSFIFWIVTIIALSMHVNCFEERKYKSTLANRC